MTSNEENQSKVSWPFIIGGSVGMFSIGLLTGVYQAFRYEKTKFDIKVHGPPMIMAGKAFVYGTMLCFGTFGVLGVSFCSLTGISSIHEFEIAAKQALRKPNVIPPRMLSENAKDDTQSIQLDSWGLNKTESDELKKFSRYVESFFYSVDDSDEENNDEVATSVDGMNKK
jgi:hypothetical protein